MRPFQPRAAFAVGLVFLACGAAAPVRPAGPVLAIWGIQPVSARVSTDAQKVDFRYRVRDPAKAAAVVNRDVLPTLQHKGTGTRLELPEQRRVGGARPPVKPEQDKNYFILFENPGALVHAGDTVIFQVGASEPVELVVQ
jgi:hypothetical protein